MKALLDINVVLDVLLVRQPWVAEASQVWDAHVNGKVTAGIAAFTVPTVFYISHAIRPVIRMPLSLC